MASTAQKTHIVFSSVFMETNSDDFIAPTSQTSFTNSHNCACALVPVFGLSLGRINILYLSQLLYNMSTLHTSLMMMLFNSEPAPISQCPLPRLCLLHAAGLVSGGRGDEIIKVTSLDPAQPSPASSAQPSQVRGHSGDSIQM